MGAICLAFGIEAITTFIFDGADEATGIDAFPDAVTRGGRGKMYPGFLEFSMAEACRSCISRTPALGGWANAGSDGVGNAW
jgi:hypothetical protein